MKVLAITQARIGSTRLPGKVLKTVEGITLLELHLRRILKAKLIDKLVVATTNEKGVDGIEKVCKEMNIGVHKGSLENVLERFYGAAVNVKPDLVVRLTSDCPLVDPEIIDLVISKAISTGLDYVSNTLNPTYPDGIDVEVFKFESLEKAMNEANLKSELEHVTPYIWKNSTFNGGELFTSDCLINDTDYSKFRLTVDTEEDLKLIKKLISLIGSDKKWKEYVTILQKNPDIMKINLNQERNEGYQKSLNNE